MSIESLQKTLKLWDRKNLTRKRKLINFNDTSASEVHIDGKKYINFSSNDYLALIKHEKITNAFSVAAQKYGFGSGASALVSGYSSLHNELETQFAEWLNVDKAIFFNSGYLANIGVISALASRADVILSDKLCHASIIDGVQLSKAKHYRYAHCDTSHLKDLAHNKNPSMIITESLFSMEGDTAPLNEIVNVAAEYKSKLIIDDAHGIGVLGSNGRGACELFNIKQDQFTCLVAPLGKAFNGVGAVVAGRKDVIDYILQFARSYHYTTSLPPAICAGLQESLRVVSSENWRREALQKIIKFFVEESSRRGLKLVSADLTPIKSIIIGDNEKLLQLQDLLMLNGMFVSAIRSPTVAVGTSRLRISLNCLHSEKQINQMLNLIQEFLHEHK